MNWKFVKAFALEVLKVWLLIAAVLAIALTVASFVPQKSLFDGGSFQVLPL